MKCKKCRKEIPDGSKFCNHCGAPCCQIKYDDGVIDVYQCNNNFCFQAHYPNGWEIKNPYVYINTVNPEAIVRWFAGERLKLPK